MLFKQNTQFINTCRHNWAQTFLKLESDMKISADKWHRTNPCPSLRGPASPAGAEPMRKPGHCQAQGQFRVDKAGITLGLGSSGPQLMRAFWGSGREGPMTHHRVLASRRKEFTGKPAQSLRGELTGEPGGQRVAPPQTEQPLPGGMHLWYLGSCNGGQGME